MASTSTQMASDSSPSTPICTYDVFLSFRGEDTRYNFTDHLYATLVQRGINTFRDDILRRGEVIEPELLKAIEESRSSIVVFSKNYAGSRWCLDELAKIMECRQESGQIILPIFYHVDPSDVRKQTGSFGEAFTRYEENWRNKVQRWREALTEASNISGWHIKEGYESEHIKKITTTIAKRISNCEPLFVKDNLVGMDSHLKKISVGLSTESDDVRMIGICGIGGIGKTTIVEYVYDQISRGFECSSFLENVREAHETKDTLCLQNQLLNDILNGENQKISGVHRGACVIKKCLYLRKALIVFDDVDDKEQLEFLARDRTWFGKGSRIIITTRNRHLLTMLQVDHVYEVEGLNSKEALKLFSQHAFLPNLRKKDYGNLLDHVIHYCQGLPLALKVLGSLLCGKTVHEWKSELHKLEKEPEAKIQKVLKTSFDKLDRTQKEIFLDIACFFKGEDRGFVSKILDGCDLHGERGIRVLWERCLITISQDRIYMHDLIQQMGWEIIREQHPDNPSQWSRLWNPNDIYCAFTSEKGMENVQTISLDLHGSKEIWFTRQIFAQMKKVFAKMEKLRLLKVNYGHGKKYKMHLPKGLEFPSNLRYLHWEGLESLPSNFHGENLVAINLKYSNIKELLEWEKRLAELKFFDLSYSRQLMKIPEFSRMPKLEKLNLEGCISFCKLYSSIGTFFEMKFLTKLNFRGSGIRELSSSIGSLISLESLDLGYCSKFEKFPDIIFVNMGRLRMLLLIKSGIKELPSSIGSLTSLVALDLKGCIKLEKLPDTIFVNMRHLTRGLSLDGSGIKELPSSIGSLTSLETLNLTGCKKLEKFPDTIFVNMGRLRKLWLSESSIKELPSSIGSLTSLETLDLRGCKKLEKFPDTIYVNMRHLTRLQLDGSGIKELPSSIGSLTSLETLDLTGCKKFEKFFDTIFVNMGRLRTLSLSESSIKELPSSIGSLTSLETLDLRGCKKFEKFPDTIFVNMGHLNGLWLDGSGIEKLPRSIGSLTSLETLYLTGCKKLEKFPNTIFVNMGHLNELWLAGNGIKELPRNILSLTSLKTLDLISWKKFEKFPDTILVNMGRSRMLCLSESSIKEFPSSIGSLTSLETLVLIGYKKFEKFPDTIFVNMGHLTRLWLDDSGIKELPSSIGSLTSLETLVLIGCKKLEKFPDTIFVNMGRLRTLWLSESSIKELPSSIGSLTSLETLDLRGCKKLEKFPDTIFVNMGHLTKLWLDGNGIKELPSSIGSLTSLETLVLTGCKKLEKFPDTIFVNMGHLTGLWLDGSGIKELPSSIGSLTSLETLLLIGWKKFEKFPDTIFVNMGRLRTLSLSESSIKELPSSIESLTSLETLDLTGCKKLEKFPDTPSLSYCPNFEKFLEIQDKTAIKELPNRVGCLKALKSLSLSCCSNFEKFPEIQRNVRSLSRLCLDETAIKELPCSIGHLTGLGHLDLKNCKSLRSLPSSICGLKSLEYLNLKGCSNLVAFPEIMEDMEHLKWLSLSETPITELRFEHLKGLEELKLNNCENLVSLPNSIGNLTCLSSLLVGNCSKLHKLPDNLRSLQCCLITLDLSGCNLMEGAIPSDLWCLSSLEYLDVSKNYIRCIPAGIIQLSKLWELRMNHCQMLEEIPELPSSLRIIEAHGCPCLGTLSTPSSPLWCLLNLFKSRIQDFGWQTDSEGARKTRVLLPGNRGIPEWVSHKSMGHEIAIELPKNWYEDNNFLGFALFSHHVPLDEDECQDEYHDIPKWEFRISDDDGSEWLVEAETKAPFCCETCSFCESEGEMESGFCPNCYDDNRPALCVTCFPKFFILREHGYSGWKNFEAHFNGSVNRSFFCGGAFKMKSCGIHLIYAQDHHQQNQSHWSGLLRENTSFSAKRSHNDTEEDPHQKRSRHL